MVTTTAAPKSKAKKVIDKNEGVEAAPEQQLMEKDTDPRIAAKQAQNTMPAATDQSTHLISQAIHQGLDAQSMEKIIDIQDRLLKREAESAFNEAMHMFQTEVDTIATNAEADTGRFKWRYAKLDHLHQKIRPALKIAELSFRFERVSIENMAFAKCVVSHVKGHSVFADFPIIVDKNAKVNEAQAYGAAIKYAQRQAFTAVLGLTVADNEDSDGGDPPQGFITEDQVLTIDTLLDDAKSNKAAFLKMCKIDKLENMPIEKYPNAIKRLEEKLK